MQEPTRSVEIGGKAYIWSEQVDEAAITIRGVRDKVQLLIDISAGILLVIFLILFIVESLKNGFPIGAMASLSGLWLSIFILFALFLFFRRIESHRQKVRIPAFSKDAPLPEIGEIRSGVPVNIAKLYSEQAMKAVEEAFSLGAQYHHAAIEPLHLFIGAMSTDEVAVAFGRLGIPFDKVKDPLKRRLESRQVGQSPAMSAAAEEVLLSAFVNAYKQGRKQVSGLEVFFESYKKDEFAKELLYDSGIDEQRLENVVTWIRISGKLRERIEEFKKAALFKPTGPMNRAMTSVATPALDAVSEDLTAMAANGRLPMLVGRDKEMEELMRVIEGGGRSVVLVGAQGTGKSAVLAGIAELMVEERVPTILEDKRLVALSLPSIISGASPEQAQERMIQVLIDVQRSRNIILAIPNLEQLTGVSSGGSATADLAALLVDFLDKSNTFAIATTTPQAYTETIERSLLHQVFEKVDVLEPEVNEAIQILESKIGLMEYEQKVVFSYEAVEKAVELSDRYMHEQYLPEKAIAIAKEVALQTFKEKGENGLVTGEDVAKIVSSKTNIPVTEVGTDEKEKLLHLDEQMMGRVIGQDDAVKAVAAALKRGRAELRSDNRPIATFLFLGPTGVGKTELAKTVAEAYFGSEDAMLRFDMSEYQDTQSIHRLIGVPGSNAGGQLTEAVRKHPFAILLLDELEKAHPDILNIFLQVFDDGRLTDAAGRTIDFTNTIIISTSNAGSGYIQDAVGRQEPLEQIKTHLMETELREVYRPEFLNRFDGVIVFRPLDADDVNAIAYLMVNKVASRLEPKGIAFRATDEAVAELAKKGFDPKFGARPLRRVVQEEVDNAIANALLEGKVARRDTIVLKEGGQIEIEKAPEL